MIICNGHYANNEAQYLRHSLVILVSLRDFQSTTLWKMLFTVFCMAVQIKMFYYIVFTHLFNPAFLIHSIFKFDIGWAQDRESIISLEIVRAAF